MVTCLGFLAGKWGGSGFPDALLPLKSDFRLNPNDLTPPSQRDPAAAHEERGFVIFAGSVSMQFGE